MSVLSTPGKLFRLLRLLRPAEFRLARGACPLCGGRVLVRLQDSEAGVRCLSCRGGPVQMSIAAAISHNVPRATRRSVYELSSGGSLFRHLARESDHLTGSEYFEDTPAGAWKNGVQCQDVEKLTYEDESFDLCTSTDVFEHVFDDRAGFREIRRVLRPGGALVFTVPLSASARTAERAIRRDGEIEHLCEPEYHDDHLRGSGQVLCVRNYGQDILNRLLEAGFTDARVETGFSQYFFGYGRPVVLAFKPAATEVGHIEGAGHV